MEEGVRDYSLVISFLLFSSEIVERSSGGGCKGYALIQDIHEPASFDAHILLLLLITINYVIGGTLLSHLNTCKQTSYHAHHTPQYIWFGVLCMVGTILFGNKGLSPS